MSQRSAFEQVALPHLEAAHNLAYWLVRSRPDAEDIVQDAFVRAFRAFASFRGGDVRPWLLTIVRNVAYRSLAVRKRGGNVVSIEDAFAPRDESDETREPRSEDPSAEEILIGNAERSLVHGALAKLPQTLREVIILREWEDLSYRAIAEVIGVPIGTVMSRLARARDLLGKHLATLVATETMHVL